jgi:hypothetical protein
MTAHREGRGWSGRWHSCGSRCRRRPVIAWSCWQSVTAASRQRFLQAYGEEFPGGKWQTVPAFWLAEAYWTGTAGDGHVVHPAWVYWPDAAKPDETEVIKQDAPVQPVGWTTPDAVFQRAERLQERLREERERERAQAEAPQQAAEAVEQLAAIQAELAQVEAAEQELRQILQQRLVVED